MKISDFEALTFDCYGTLIDWETGIAEALAAWANKRGVGAGAGDLLEAFGAFESKHQAAMPDALYPEILAAVLRDIGAQLGAEASAEEQIAFGRSVQDWPAFPDSAESLAYLKRHYKLVIVSNIDRESFRQSNAKLEVEFDRIITAQDVGSYKPAPGHFTSMLAELAEMGVGKEKILHTAQSLFHDHVPAKQFGLTTMWINRQAGRAGGGATPAPSAAVKPDFEVPSMAAMVDLHKSELAAA
ncbi:MAG TPA: haloacid dehalogenase type II [Kiloniellales bacterium]